MRFSEANLAAAKAALTATKVDVSKLSETELLRIGARLRRASRDGTRTISEIDVLRALEWR